MSSKICQVREQQPASRARFRPARASGLALLAAALLLASCLQRTTPEPIELTWWITFAADSAEYPAFEAVARAYATRTGYTVDLVPVAWDDILPRGSAATKLSIAQASGRGPDVWGPVPHNWTSSFAANGQVLALDMAQIESASQYTPLAAEACRIGDTQYALPVLMDSVALLYNKSMVTDPPKTFDDLLKMAAELGNPAEDRWGLALPLLSQYHTYPFIDGYGGYIFRCQSSSQCDVHDIGLNSEGAVRGTQLLSQWYLDQKLFPETMTDRPTMYRDAVRLFREGRAAMLIDGPWITPELKDSGLEYGVASLPRLPGAEEPPHPLVVVQAMSVSAQSAHPQEAIDLVNHIASPQSVLEMHQVWPKIPVRTDVLRTSPLREDRLLAAWQEQIAAGVALPNVPELDYVWTPWGQALEQAILGYTPTQEALDEAVEQIKSIME